MEVIWMDYCQISWKGKVGQIEKRKAKIKRKKSRLSCLEVINQTDSRTAKVIEFSKQAHASNRKENGHKYEQLKH